MPSGFVHRLPERLRHAIVHRLGFQRLRPVQELAGEALLDGHNAVILAPTAGGKTEAALFPALAGMLDAPPSSVGVLYVAPTKALLNNQGDRMDTMCQMVGLRRFVWHGDASSGDKRRFVREPGEVLMTTPESLEVMLRSKKIACDELFADLSMIVVDEIHAMAGDNRGAHLLAVIERLVAQVCRDVQRVGLSATVGNPDQMLAWLSGSSQRLGTVVNPPTRPKRRELLVVRPGKASRHGDVVLGSGKSLFFCSSRELTEAVAGWLQAGTRRTDVFVHHSSVSKERRLNAERRFASGTADACIVCTSTLELGIDIGDLDRVFQSGATRTVSSFLQRMGRTGRRPGQTPNTTFFCGNHNSVLQSVALIELAKKGWVENIDIDDRNWPVLVQQILALALARGSFVEDDIWQLTRRVPDFAGIDRNSLRALLEHLAEEDFLVVDRRCTRLQARLQTGCALMRADAGGREVLAQQLQARLQKPEAGESRLRRDDLDFSCLATAQQFYLGDASVRTFGAKNFMSLYSVFWEPRVYRCDTVAGQVLGELEYAFVAGLQEEESTFALGARYWLVEQILHKERRVVVSKARKGTEPSWNSSVPYNLGFELCQQIRDCLASDDRYAYLDPSAAYSVAMWRDRLQRFLRAAPAPVLADDDGHVTWWTFAGGRINRTLASRLGATSDNFAVRIRGDDEQMLSAIAALRDVEEWTAGHLTVNRRRPLTKFDCALPDWACQEQLAKVLVDPAGARDFVARFATQESTLRSTGNLPTIMGNDDRPRVHDERARVSRSPRHDCPLPRV